MGSKQATANTSMPELVRLAVPLHQQSERLCPRTGPVAKPVIPDWVMAAWIMIAILLKKKSQSAQYRALVGRRDQIADWLENADFSSRASYFRRYRSLLR